MSDSMQPHRRQPTRLPRPWDSPGKNTGVGCHLLLQGVVSTQGSNPGPLCLRHWQAHSLPLCCLGRAVKQAYSKSNRKSSAYISQARPRTKKQKCIIKSLLGEDDWSEGRQIMWQKSSLVMLWTELCTLLHLPAKFIY